MRLVSALLFVALTGSTAFADETKPVDSKAQVAKRKVPLRVVKVLPETQQVLLFDRNRGTHVVAEVGQEVDGYLVDEIDDDEVTLIAPSGAEVILTAPDPAPPRRVDRKAPRGGSPAKTDEPQPIDPYADAASEAVPSATGAAGDAGSSTTAAVTPGEGSVRVASAADKGPTAAPRVTDPIGAGLGPAPIVDAGAPALSDPYADVDPGIAAFADAVGATPQAIAPGPKPAAKNAPAAATAAPKAGQASDSSDAAGALAAAATGSTTAATTATTVGSSAAASTGVTVARADVDAALADFGATAVTFDAAFVASGLRFEHVATGTILAKLGLRAGDVLTAVDGKPLRSLDDAASLYARAGTARSATLSVLRGGTPMTLRVTIR